MTKPTKHLTHSLTVLELLGTLVSQGRRERGWTEEELASRCGVTAKTLRKVESGDPSVRIGTAFDAAVLVGVHLFAADRAEVEEALARETNRLAVLPARVRRPRGEVWDDF